MITIEDIIRAGERTEKHIIKTPLIRLENGDDKLGCIVYIKAENLQRTGSFKLRGAVNKILSLSPEEISKGFVCASSGNHGRAVAYAAARLGTEATVVIPETAPEVKIDGIKSLGAEVVLCPATERFKTAEEICRNLGATLIPPYNDEFVMAGQGTAGLEIAEQLPEADTVIVPVSGGGLIGGVATALKESIPGIKVCGVEPANLPRYSESLKAGKPVEVEFKPTVADALVSQKPGPLCFPQVQKYVDEVVTVSEEGIKEAWSFLLKECKILAEPSSCTGIAAVMEGKIKVKPEEKVCFLISGGNVGINI